MIVSIRIPDELYAQYAERNPKKPQEELELALAEFAPFFPGKKRVVVEGADLKELSRLLEWPVSSAKELIERVARVKRVALPEGEELELNEGQLLRMKAQADFLSKAGKASPEEFAAFVKQQLQAGLTKVAGA